MCRKLIVPICFVLVVGLTGIANAVDDVADSDIPVDGTVIGDYSDTQTSNDVNESIEEVESKGKPDNRYSFLEHKWTIDVTGGTTVTFYVEAYHTSNAENDDFVFAYSSSEEGSYTDMVTVTKTSDDDTYQSYELPGDTNGVVYIQVTDTDQTAGNKTLDTIYVDHMYIQSVTAPTAPGQASNPDPCDGATGVSTDVVLSWTAGEFTADTNGHDVYFGTNFNDVNDANTSTAGIYKGNQDSNSYDPPGTLTLGQTYYWRIDEVNDVTTKGDVWSFEVETEAAGTPASSPDPETGEKYAASDVVVSWVAGDSVADVNGHDVYFGTSFSDVNTATTASGEYMGWQTDNIFDTNNYVSGGLTQGDTYYWRIDEVNGVTTWKGDVWSFTVSVYINVKTDLGPLGIHDSNAAGDGSTNDTNAIRAAIDWVDNNVPYGGVVYFPAGTYRFEYFEIANDVEVRGAGTSQTIFRPTETSGGAKLIRVRGGKLRDFTAYGTKPSQSGANWEVDVGGPSYVILARGIDNGALIDNVVALEGKYDPLYLRGSKGLRVTNSVFNRGSRACVSFDALDGVDEQFVFAESYFGPLRGSYLFNMEPSTGLGDCVRDGLFLTCDFYGEASGAYGTGTTYWGCFLGFKGFTEEPSGCKDVVVLNCDFEDAHIWVNKIFRNVYVTRSDIDSVSSGYSCFEESDAGGELPNCKVLDNDFIGATTWDDVKDGVNFSGTSSFKCNTPEFANDETCSYPDCNQANQDLLAATDDISELTFEQLHDLAKTCPGQLQVWYSDHYWELGQASSPGPVNQQTNVSRTANLSWTAGYRATSHRVYFGTSSPGGYQVTQTATSFSPGVMAANTTYYWRIDGVCAGGEKTGKVWSFTTGTTGSAPGLPSDPEPADEQTNVSRNADLSWSAAEDADSYDVYLGTSSPGESQGNQTDTTFDPGMMDATTTYYWRIDPVNPFGTTTGTVWSFTTSATTAQYTETRQVWYATAENVWQTKDLSGYGVPANAVVEITMINSHTDFENFAGVRKVGSSLDRRIELHEAEGGGWDAYSMQVVADADSKIQHFAEDAEENALILIGWWSAGTYVEKMELFTIVGDQTWVDVDLSSYGVPGNRVVEIVLANHAEDYECLAGVRANGSSLPRIVDLHEAEGKGVDTATMMVKTDADGKIEAYAEDDGDMYFIIVGYWSEAPGTYTEKFVDIGEPPYSNIWCDKDLTGYGVPAGSVVEMLLGNDTGSSYYWTGVRKSAGLRVFKLQEAEDGGEDYVGAHVMSNASGNIQVLFEEIVYGDGTFYLLGYWQ